MKTVTLSLIIEVKDAETKQAMDDLLEDIENRASMRGYSIHDQAWDCEDGELFDCEEHAWGFIRESSGTMLYRCVKCGAEWLD